MTMVSVEFTAVIPKRVLQEFRRKLCGHELVWLGKEDSSTEGVGCGLGPE